MVEGSFVQNVAYSLSGNAVVLGIGFILTPIIARIYGPDAYGKFALFTAIISFIQPFATLQFQAGFVAMKPDQELYDILKITLFSLLSVTLLSLVSVMGIDLIFGGLEQNYVFFYLLPLYILFGGIYNILRGLNIMLEEFRRSAISKSLATILGKGSTLGYGYLISRSATGMIIGGIITFAIESSGYVSGKISSLVKKALRHKTDVQKLKAALRKYREYPLFVLSNTLANSFGNQIPIYFFSFYYSTTEVGLYSLAMALLTIPVNLFGTSVGAVLLPKISNNIADKSARNKLLVELYNKIYYPGLLGMIMLSILLYYFLPIILGDSWRGIGQLSAVLAIGFTMHLLALPFSVIYRLINYERKNLSITISFSLLKIIGLFMGWYWGGYQEAVFTFVGISLVQNGFQVFFIMRKLAIETNRHLINLAISILLFITASLFIPS